MDSAVQTSPLPDFGGLAALAQIVGLTFFLAQASGGACLAANGPLAVDVVTLKSGRSLRGAVLNRQPDGTLTMAVSRAWLEHADPMEFAKQAERDANLQRAARTETRDRIEKELADPPEAPRLAFFLKQELKRLEKELAAEKPVPPQFLLLDLPPAQVAKTVPASAERQRIALFAWSEGLAGVETTSAQTLRKQLIEAGIGVDGPAPDLSDKLPARPQSDAEWSARLALVEYTLAESLDFQGMGDTLVRTGDGQKISLAAVLPKLLASQVDSLLGDFLEPGRKPRQNNPRDKDVLRPAIAIAEKNRQHGFRVTRLELNAERLAVAVQTDFVAKLPDRDWQTIWSQTETADGSKPRPEAEARIADDPQVKTMLESLNGLGLAGDDTLRQAFRVGAATMAAQQAADARFFEFRDRYVKRLDGPMLVLPGK